MKSAIENLTNNHVYIIIGFIVVLVSLAIILFLILLWDLLRVPFRYPQIIMRIDLSGKRQVSYEEYVDDWLISLNGHGREALNMFNDAINTWELEWKDYLEKTRFGKKRKLEAFMSMKQIVAASDYHFFKFEFIRSQTRYRQSNYQKYPYTVHTTEYVLSMTLRQIMEIDDELEEIDYETSRNKYYAENQRKLMTKELRHRIIERDNYTCQICGKYMPDEVGLHVDHIIPIKKGGKSVASNLQVLCDKCNLHKGKK